MKVEFLKFLFISSRNFKSKFSNKTSFLTYFGIPFIIGLLAALVMKTTAFDSYSYVSNPQIKNFLFLIIIISIFVGLTNSIREIVSFRAHLTKERRTGLSVSLYLLSTFSVLTVILSVQILILIFISDVILDFPGSFVEFFLWPFIAGIAATATGLLISSLVASEIAAMSFIPLVLIPQMIFSGSLIDFNKMNKEIFISYYIDEKKGDVPEISNIMISRWAVESYILTIATLDDPRKACMSKYSIIEESLKKKREEGLLSIKQFKEERIKQVDLPIEQECFLIDSTINEYLEIDDEKNSEYKTNNQYRYVLGEYVQTVNFNMWMIWIYIFVFVLMSIASLKYDWWDLFKKTRE